MCVEDRLLNGEEHTSLLHALVGGAILLEAVVLAGFVGVRHV